MSETNENPETVSVPKCLCDRCGKEKPTALYKPNAGKHPAKTIRICLDCANDDPNCNPMANPAEPDVATQDIPIGSGTPDPEPENVPDLSTAKPLPDTEPKITEFKPVTPAPLPASPAPIEADKKIRATNNTAPNVETKPINRVDIENKIAGFSADIEKLVAQHNKLAAQIAQTKSIIEAKRGAIAGLESVLG